MKVTKGTDTEYIV